MCPDCERLQRIPSLSGRHLVHPVDRTRHVVDQRREKEIAITVGVHLRKPVLFTDSRMKQNRLSWPLCEVHHVKESNV